MKKFAITFIYLLFAIVVAANIKLPFIYSDNMVLQRGKPIIVWGWGAANEKVTVKFHEQTASAKTNKGGRWQVTFKPENAGGPFTLTATAKNSVTVNNILVGEVWFCSGQSNMEMHVKHSYDRRYENDIKTANNDQIRHFKVKNSVSDSAVADIEGGEWKLGNDSASVADFSSVGYFFAKKLYEELKVPIGLINSSWGGTMVETWMSRDIFLKDDTLKNIYLKSYNEVKDGNWTHPPNRYPNLLYNGMVQPLIQYSIKGFLWYQGETNASRAQEYRKTFPLLIQDWRNKWKDQELPFYFVQLSSFIADSGTSNKGSAWAELREAQTLTLKVPNTGMAVTTDVGDTKDIHPPNKKDVGLRLAAIALNKAYGKGNPYSGPRFDGMSVDKNKAVIKFADATKLVVGDKYGYLKGFEIASSDKKFYYAKAHVEGNNVVLYSDSVSTPVSVRYAWADDAPEANLYNSDGFPAGSFRTDVWPGKTDGVKYIIQ